MRAALAIVVTLIGSGSALGGLLSRAIVAPPTSAEVFVPGDSPAPISADGRYVAFTSTARLVPPEPSPNHAQVYVHDRLTDTNERVSVGPGGVAGNDQSGPEVAISADGSVVAFASAATNLAPGSNGHEVFVRDRTAGTTTRASVGPGGATSNGISTLVGISADGNRVLFTSTASNLVAGDTNGFADVFVYDRTTGVTSRVGVDAGGGQLASGATIPAMSADGSRVAFLASPDVFVRDTVAGTTTCVSVDPSNTPAGAISGSLRISPNGRYVTFVSLSGAIVPSAPSGGVFVRDLDTATTTLVSDRGGRVWAVLDDQRFLLGLGDSPDLVPSDVNGVADLYLYDRPGGTYTLASVSSRGTFGSVPVGGQNIGDAAISPDGRFVAFSTDRVGLDYSDRNGAIFVRDLQPACGNGTLDLGEECDDGNLVDGDGCGSTCEVTPCANGTTIAKALVRRTINTKNTENITITGRLVFPPGVPATFDPATAGAQIILEDLGHGYSTLARRDPGTPIPGGAAPTGGCGTFASPDGWTTKAGGAVQTYVNHTGDLPPLCPSTPSGGPRGVTKITFHDLRASRGTITFTIKARRQWGVPEPAIGPYRVTIALGGRTASQSGACGTHTFTPAECSALPGRFTCTSP